MEYFDDSPERNDAEAVSSAGKTVSEKDTHNETVRQEKNAKPVRNISAVRPERTDVLRHASDTENRHSLQHRRRRKEDTLIFGVVQRQTMSLIMLVILFIVGILFGIREIGVSIPIFLIIMVIEFIMGLLLGSSPSFVAILLCAALMIVGAFTGMFVPVCIGSGMLLGTVLMIKGE